MSRIPILGMLVLTLGISSCATSDEIRLRMRVAELEQIVANKDDDLGYMMKALFEQQEQIYMLERGAQWQAREMARIRETCEL